MADVTAFLFVSLRFMIDLDVFMTSSQRVYDYMSLPIEDELEKKIDKDLEKISWPSKGQIEFSNVCMRYRDGLEPSIKGLDCII